MSTLSDIVSDIGASLGSARAKDADDTFALYPAAIAANFNIHSEEKTPNNSHKYFRARGRNRRGNRRYLKTLGENSNKRAEASDRRSSSRGFRRGSPPSPSLSLPSQGKGGTIPANYNRSNVTGTKLPRGKQIVGARRNRCE